MRVIIPISPQEDRTSRLNYLSKATEPERAELQCRFCPSASKPNSQGTGNRKMLLEALLHDPVCAFLKPEKIIAMGNELLEANKEFLP